MTTPGKDSDNSRNGGGDTDNNGSTTTTSTLPSTFYRRGRQRTLVLCIMVLVASTVFQISSRNSSIASNSLAAYYNFSTTATSKEAAPCPPPQTGNKNNDDGLQEPKRKKFALVHLLDEPNPLYVLALLTSAHRQVELYNENINNSNNSTSNDFPHQLDLVAMIPNTTDAQALRDLQHPYIKFVRYDPTPIDRALKGKSYWKGTMYKLMILSLVEYDKIFFMDLDVMSVQPLTSVFQDYVAPGMVYWNMYPQYSFNSGCSLIEPSQAMYDDAIAALHQLWSNKGDESTPAEIGNRASQTYLHDHPHDLPPSAQVGNYRGDQEFLHAFFNIVPQTSHKYGPIKPLPYGLCARAFTVVETTEKFLDHSSSLNREALFDGGLLHLYGGYGHDGNGHWIHKTRQQQQGLNNLFNLHFTVNKPWDTGRRRRAPDNISRDVMTNTSMTPQERCPLNFFQLEFWMSAFDALGVALAHPDTSYYGKAYVSSQVMEIVDRIPLLKTCMLPELEKLKSAAATATPKAITDAKVASYTPLIEPRKR